MSIIAAPQSSPHWWASSRTSCDELLGLDEPALEVHDERQQATRPVGAGAIAEPVERGDRAGEPRLGTGVIAAQERDPRQVLAHPGPPAHVADAVVDRVGLAEVPLGVGERTTEDLGEPPRPQRGGEVPVVAELAEDVDGPTEVLAGCDEIAVELLDDAEQPVRLALGHEIVGAVRVVEQLQQLDACAVEGAHLDESRRVAAAATTAALGVVADEAERPLRRRDAPREGADLVRLARRAGEQIDGLESDRRRDTRHRTELVEQLGRGGGVVGEIVERHLAERREMGRDARVALGARLLRERLVGDLADDVAAELPAPALDLEHPGDDEIVDETLVEVLPERFGELGEGAERSLGAEDRGVVEDRPLSRRQLVEPGRDQRPQRARQRDVDAPRRRPRR